MPLRVGYKRPDLDEALLEARDIAQRVAGATATDAVGLVQEFDALRARLFSLQSWAWLAHNCDFADQDAQREQDFWDSVAGKVEQVDSLFWEALLMHEAAMLDQLGPQAIRLAKAAALPDAPQGELLAYEVSVLRSDVCRFLSAPRIALLDNTFSVTGIRKLFTHHDRDVRRAAWEARDACCAEHSKELEASITRLNAARYRQATAFGFAGYSELAPHQARRAQYAADDLVAFRRAVLEHIVPLCADVSNHHRKQLQLDALFAYDEEVLSPADAPTPLGDVAKVVETLAGICAELHPRIAEFFTAIVREDLLDLEQRPDKTQSAGCMFIADRRLPFILASYGGYPRDVDVIVHEFGHGFHQFAAREQPLLNYALADGDLAELCAMGMTIITLPYLSRFYGERHPTLSRSVLWTLVRLMPFVTLLDHFEQEVFAGTPPSPDDCNQLWLNLEQQYMPWRRYGATMPHLSAGASWQLYAHTEPFHSIGYAIAAASALQLLPRVRANHPAAVEAYINLCTAGASKQVQELLPLAGIASPFHPDTIAQLAKDLRAELIEAGAGSVKVVD